MSTSYVRQGTFDTAPADSISGNSIKRGGIEIPIVDETSKRTLQSHQQSTKLKTKILNRTNRSSSKSEANSLSKNAKETKRSEESPDNDGDIPKISSSVSKKVKSDENRKRSPSPKRKRFRDEDKAAVSGHTDNKTAKVDHGSRTNAINSQQHIETSSRTNAINSQQHIETSSRTNTINSQQHIETSSRTNTINSQQHVETSSPPQSHLMSPSLARKIQKGREANNRVKPQIILENPGQSDLKAAKPKNVSKRGHVSPTPSRYEEISLPSRQREKGTLDSTSDVVVPSFKGQSVSRMSFHSENSQLLTVNNHGEKVHGNTREARDGDTVTNSVDMSSPVQRTRNENGRMESSENVRMERDGLLRAEIAYKTRIRQLEDDAKEFLRNIEELSDENRILRENTSDSSARVISELDHTSKENRDLLERNQKLEIENQSVWVENEKLKSSFDDCKTKTEISNKENESVMKRLKDSESKASLKVKELELEKIKIETDLKNLRTSNEELEKKLNSLKDENKTLNKSLEQRTVENSDLLKSIQNDNSKDLLKKTQEELTQALAEHEKSKTEIEELKKKYLTLQKEKSLVEKKLVDKEKQVSDKDKQLDEKSKQFSEQTDTHKEKLSEKDNEIKVVKDTLNKKKVSIIELQQQITTLKIEIEKLKSENGELNKIDRDVAELRAKIKTLTDDLGKRTEGNKKLKRQKSEAKIEIESLKKELELANSANLSETKHLKQLLQKELENNEQMKTEFKEKQSEISKYETQLFEINMKVDSQNEKMRELQREKNDLEVRVSRVTELEDSNKSLLDENRRLRQMLVERNIEVTNRKTEKNVLTSRLDSLERKQKDSEIKVKQLQGWVSDAFDVNDSPIVVVTTSPPPQRNKQRSPRSLPLNRKKNQHGKLREDSNKAASYEDIRQIVPEESPKPSPSLPSITDTGDQTIRPSYFQLYKHKLKLINDRR